jgi:cyclopropane fatty-acyl-phospholipid synthase-like methyltransferase
MNNLLNPIGAATDRVDIFDPNQDEFSLLAHLARYAFVVRQCKLDDLVVEVGSGTGYGANFISKHVSHVTAYEPFVDPKILATKWERENLTFVDVIETKSQYDKVIALEVVEHMPRREADDFIRFLISLGKGNTVWFISTPRKLEDRDRSDNRKKAHPFEYSFSEFQGLLENYFEFTHILSQNDALISSQNSKMAWNYLAICTNPKSVKI